MMATHFGYLNHNPGNLRYEAVNKWLGLAAQPRYVPSWDKQGFFIFREARYGVRACAMTLLHYQRVLKLRTLRQIFARYAPAGDNNDPTVYAQVIGAAIGKSVDEPIDLNDAQLMRRILPAIFLHETGQVPPYGGEVYEAALDLVPSAPPRPAPAPVAPPPPRGFWAWLVELIGRLFGARL